MNASDNVDPIADDTNPFIAFTDVGINLILIMVFFVVAILTIAGIGQHKSAEKKLAQAKASDEEMEAAPYRRAMREFYRAVMHDMPRPIRPRHIDANYLNDPAGTQRWSFLSTSLFYPQTAELTPHGKTCLVEFARLLASHKDKWRRIRVEGHTMPPQRGERDDWELSAQRASVVARVFYGSGISPHFMAVAGRAGQAPYPEFPKWDPRNERVEIVIEFSLKTATGQPVK